MSYLIILFSCLISTAAYAHPQAAPMVLDHSELIKILTGLFFVIFIIVLLSWLVKRFNVVQLSTSRGFEAVATMTLGPKEKITLLKVGSRYLLIGVGSGAINTLYDFGEQLPDGFSSENNASFAELLKSVVRKQSK